MLCGGTVAHLLRGGGRRLEAPGHAGGLDVVVHIEGLGGAAVPGGRVVDTPGRTPGGGGVSRQGVPAC